jgi:hypothetical protein
MKANVFTSVVVALFLFATNCMVVKADSNAVLYHNVEKSDNVVSTTYFKGDGKNENLIPFKKKVNTLNEQGVCLSKVTYVFDMDSKSWIPFDKLVYTYDNGKLISLERMSWNEKGSTWDKPEVTSYSYTSEGNIALSE